MPRRRDDTLTGPQLVVLRRLTSNGQYPERLIHHQTLSVLQHRGLIEAAGDGNVRISEKGTAGLREVDGWRRRKRLESNRLAWRLRRDLRVGGERCSGR